jgi:hypothetical protein
MFNIDMCVDINNFIYLQYFRPLMETIVQRPLLQYTTPSTPKVSASSTCGLKLIFITHIKFVSLLIMLIVAETD